MAVYVSQEHMRSVVIHKALQNICQTQTAVIFYKCGLK